MGLKYSAAHSTDREILVNDVVPRVQSNSAAAKR